MTEEVERFIEGCNACQRYKNQAETLYYEIANITKLF